MRRITDGSGEGFETRFRTGMGWVLSGITAAEHQPDESPMT